MDKKQLRETFEMLVLNGDLGADWYSPENRKEMLSKITPRPPKKDVEYLFGAVEVAFQAFCVAAKLYVNNRHISQAPYGSAIFEVGDIVFTAYTGKIARHKVVGIERKMSQSGISYQVDPPIGEKSSPDRWIDQAWFVSLDNVK